MKFYALLFLCFAVALGEKKINLEDIERDNLQSEAQTEEDSAQPEEANYNSEKTESNVQLQYRTEPRLIGGQQQQEIKYVTQPEEYNQDSQAYQQYQQQQYQQQPQQQQHSAGLSQQQQQGPQQFYNTAYQTVSDYPAQKSSPQISYQPQLSQGLTYQNEILVGNQIQSYQQKIATEKFSQGIGKAASYASGNQQLLYYPSLNSPTKNQAQPLLHRLAHEAARTVPAYTTTVSQEPKIAYQLQPQIQYVYEPQYVQPAKPTYSPKSTEQFAYHAAPAPAPAAAAPEQTYASPQSYSGLTHSQQSSLYTQQPKLAYTQAYYIQPQLNQYYQKPAYQGNSLSYTQSQPLYIPPNLAQQLQTQVLAQHGSHSIAQNYAKVLGEPSYQLTVPQIPTAQYYKTGPVTHLQPVNTGISYPSNRYYYTSGAKSLLDSYTPSHIIAAQDSERYRERPLHLESGFLPFKGSYQYVHSHNQKRKSE